MKKYFFTFGQNHYTKEGFPMKNSWVEVNAKSYNLARECFVDVFMNQQMIAPDKFAFQYEEGEKFWEESKHLYKNGCFLTLYYPNDTYQKL